MINRREIATIVASRITGYRIEDIEQVIDEVEKVICEGLENGEEVKLHKLLKFSVYERGAHQAHDGLHNRDYQSESKKLIRIKKLVLLNKAENKLNGEDRHDTLS